ncbi:MAG TPA: tyrosine-protein phosphatase [Chloroflexota bacterium]|nr:tyrosine-protein phosphatase [Chloroflexota bacterium]
MADEKQRSRWLAWEGALNARDLGGYPTADGWQTRWGAAVRSDDPARLTAAGRSALVDYGVRSIVDLRGPKEIDESPEPFAEPGPHGIAYTHVPFIDPHAGPAPAFTTLADDYKGMLDRFNQQVAAIVRAIARAPEGGVLIHCAGGKDRTGIISALLLDLARVPRQTIGADYALSVEYFHATREEWLANGPGDRAAREAELAKYLPRAEVMLEVLAHLDERYGGVEAYLLRTGVMPQEIARLRERLRGARGLGG